jgi:hypothetical protein
MQQQQQEGRASVAGKWWDVVPVGAVLVESNPRRGLVRFELGGNSWIVDLFDDDARASHVSVEAVEFEHCGDCFEVREVRGHTADGEPLCVECFGGVL